MVQAISIDFEGHPVQIPSFPCDYWNSSSCMYLVIYSDSCTSSTKYEKDTAKESDACRGCDAGRPCKQIQIAISGTYDP